MGVSKASLGLYCFLFFGGVMTISCSSKTDDKRMVKYEQPSELQKTSIDSSLIGIWKLDSIFRDAWTYPPSVQGYMFKGTGKAYYFEKTDRYLKEPTVGDYRTNGDSLLIDLVNDKSQQWIFRINGNKLEMHSCTVFKSGHKPILHLTKTEYDSIKPW